MSKRFVTQFTEVLPKVLIIGESLDLAFKIIDLFHGRSFKAEFLEVNQLRSPSSAEFQKFTNETYYKIIFLFNLSHNLQTVSDALKILQNRREPLLILTRFDSIIDVDNDFTRDWFQTSLAQYNNLVELERHLPRASFIIARDLILADSSFHPAGSLLFGQLSEQKIVNPQQDFSFVSQASFLEQIQNQLFAPYTGEKMLFQANSIPSARAIRTFCEYFSFSCDIINQAYPPGVFEFPFPLTTISGFSDLDFVSARFFDPYSFPPAPTLPAKTPPSQSISPISPPSEASLTSEPAQPGRGEVSLPTKKPSRARGILSQAKKVLTSKEEKFLQQYLGPAHLNPHCETINLSGFNFLHCSISPPRPRKKITTTLIFALPPTPQVTLPLTYVPPQAQVESSPIKLPTQVASSSASKTPLIGKKGNSNWLKAAKAVFQPLKANSEPKKSLFAKSFPKLIFSSRRVDAVARKNRSIFLAAVTAGATAILLFFLYFQPRQNQNDANAILQQFFTACATDELCLHTNTVTSPILLSFVPAPESQAFLAQLAPFLDRYQRLDQQLARFFAVAWQNQSGSPADELSTITTSLSSSLEDLDQIQTLYDRQQSFLGSFLSSEQLTIFQTRLTAALRGLASLQKNLPLLQQLATTPQLNAAFLLFDHSLVQTAGGQFLGIDNFQLTQGKFSPGDFHSATSIAARSTLEVNPPAPLLDRPQMESAGIYNLGFGRDFRQTAAHLAQILESALGAQPDLIIALNPSILADLGQLTGSASLDLQGKSVTEKESLLQQYLPSFRQSLASLAPDQAPLFLYRLLAHLDDQSLQFYAADRDLATTIASLNLDNDPANIICPAGLGSATCYLDTFVQNDNYLAPNSSLAQSITHQIDLTPATTTHQRTITYDNSGSDSAALTHLSFQLPAAATVSAFTARGIVSELDEDNGFIVRVEPGQKYVLELEFSLPRVIEKNDLTYSFYDQHQNGLTRQNLQVSFSNHLPYSPKIIAPAATSDTKNIVFNPLADQSFFGAVAFY